MSIFTAAGPALSQPAEPQLFAVTATGPAAVPGREPPPFRGVAFAIGPDSLLTAQGAVGDPARFSPAVRFAKTSVPDRTIELFGNGGPAFPAGVAAADGPAAVLVRSPQEPPLARARLSACPPGQAGLRLRADGEIPVEPVLSGGVVTHYRVTRPDGWDGRGFLGAPLLDGEGRVAGMLADVADDRRHVAIAPMAALAHLVPQATPIDCDPRPATGIAALNRTTGALSARVGKTEGMLQETQQALNVVTSGLADVADIFAGPGEGQADIEPVLRLLRDTLQPAQPLAGRVSSISTILQRPTWTTKAKFSDSSLTLTLTFAYRMQLPGRPLSQTLHLCSRLLMPYQGQRDSEQYFRSPAFYAAAARPGRCKEAFVNLPNPGGPSDWGEYRAELYLNDFEHEFREYVAGRNWIDPAHPWNRVIFVALVRPEAAGGPDPQGAAVIQRALIRLPEGGDGSGGARPVECRVFDSDQEVIDFLAEMQPPVSPSDLSTTGFDDLPRLKLDPANASDECVPSSAS
ncbi:hypothetical protein [Paracoccus sp. MC1862]|uniref:hypothetical protein n=1 Tax=Paracoccus sp. MC1862 TaxID=2760307 RepID=UPI0016032275|nr:hypothetical protein [Paracoccus sp. MC1862]MBB1498416.1 hypothetical protein [Paracoccus sp. MC1862]